MAAALSTALLQSRLYHLTWALGAEEIKRWHVSTSSAPYKNNLLINHVPFGSKKKKGAVLICASWIAFGDIRYLTGE